MTKRLLLLLASIGCAGPLVAQQAVPAQIEGRLELAWGMLPTLDGPPAIRVFVHDDATRRTHEVEIGATAARQVGGLLGLNGKRVRLALREAGRALGAPSAPAVVTDVISVVADAGRQVPDLAAHATLAGAQPPQFGTRRYAVLLCKFPDSLNEHATQAQYQAVMFGPSMSVAHYWHEASENRIDLSTGMVTAWIPLPQPRAYYFPNGPTSNADLGRLATDCITAADPVVDFSQFYGIVAQFNTTLGCCGWGGGWTATVDGATRSFGFAWMPGGGPPNSMGFYGHEVGHSLGLPHSGGPYGRTYDSWWDVMSAAHAFWDPVRGLYYGAQTIGYHKDLLGWIPGARRVVTVGSSSVVQLGRHAQPANDGTAQMIVVPIQGTNTFYTAEARLRVGYDDRIPHEGVLIHHVEPTSGRMEPAWVVDADGNGNTNDAGAIWAAGESFVDAQRGIAITIESRTGNTFAVRVRNSGVASLALERSSRSTTVTAGDPATDDSLDVTVTGAAAATTAWTAAKQGFRGSWLSLTTATGTGSGRLRLRRDPRGLGAGTYVDSVLVSAPNVTPAYYVDSLLVLPSAALFVGLSVVSRLDSGMAPYGWFDSADVRVTGPGAATAAWSATKRRSSTFFNGAPSGVGPGRVRWYRGAAASPLTVDTITVTLTGTGQSVILIDSFRTVSPVLYTIGPRSRRDSTPEGAYPVLDSVSVGFNSHWAAGAGWSHWSNWWLGGRFLRAVPIPLVPRRGDGYAVWRRGAPALPPGTYIDSIQIAGPWWWFAVPSTGHQSGPFVVDTLLVYSAPLSLTLSKSSSRAVIASGLALSTDSVLVHFTGTGSATSRWNFRSRRSRSVQVTEGGFVTPGSGTGSAWLRWTRNVAGLAPGTYVDTLSFTSTALPGVDRQLIDTVVVLAGLSVFADVTSRRDSAVAGTSGVRADSVRVAVLGLNVSPQAWQASKRAAWTQILTGAGTDSGVVRWVRDPAGLAIGPHVDTITIAAAGGGLAATIIDTFLILPAGSRVATSVFAPDSVGDRFGQPVSVELRLDMSASASTLGGYAATVSWDSTVLRLDSVRSVAGGFAAPVVGAIEPHRVPLSASQPSGLGGTVALARLFFRVEGGAAGQSTNITSLFTQLSESGTGASLLGILAMELGRGTSTGSLRGDASLDGLITALDAQAVLQYVIAIALPAAYRPLHGDANCNGVTEALDALIILMHTVGLPVTQFCVGTVR